MFTLQPHLHSSGLHLHGVPLRVLALQFCQLNTKTPARARMWGRKIPSSTSMFLKIGNMASENPPKSISNAVFSPAKLIASKTTVSVTAHFWHANFLLHIIVPWISLATPKIRIRK